MMKYEETFKAATRHLIPAAEKSNATYITRTRLYNFASLKPHFYIVKLSLEFTGYRLYILFC